MIAKPRTPNSAYSMSTLQGKSILITGGGTGIGAGCAAYFAARGARVTDAVDPDAPGTQFGSQNARGNPILIC